MTKKLFIISAIFLFFFSICCHADGVNTVVRLAKQAESQNDYSTAIRCYSKLIKKSLEDGKADTVLCNGLFDGGTCCANSNRYIEALQFYTLAIEQAEKCNKYGTKLSCLNNIGNVYALFNDYERAAHYYEKAYGLALKRRNDKMLSILSINLVKIYSQLGRIAKAKEFLNLQMLYPRAERFVNQYYILRNQGIIAKAEHNYTLANSFFEQAKETVIRHDLKKDDLADIHIEMGDMRRQQGQNGDAVREFLNAVTVAKKETSCSSCKRLTRNLPTHTRRWARQTAPSITSRCMPTCLIPSSTNGCSTIPRTSSTNMRTG